MYNQHVMVDLETMGTGSFAPIISIGAVRFDPLFPDDEVVFRQEDTFHVFINLEDAAKYGRLDVGTVLWWMGTERSEARDNLLEGLKTAVQLDEALIGFSDWFGDDKPLWGNGATFDNVVLSNAYQATGLDKPWTYKSDRCFRTLKALKLPSLKPEMPGVEHNALFDAQQQVVWLRRIVRDHGLNLE